jgi:hypothetical protein
MRTSDRVYVETAIIISGTDSRGRRFEENTKAVVLSRRGAEIVSKQTLVPQQVLTIQCLKTGVDTGVGRFPLRKPQGLSPGHGH